jgi:hypothetical protein
VSNSLWPTEFKASQGGFYHERDSHLRIGQMHAGIWYPTVKAGLWMREDINPTESQLLRQLNGLSKYHCQQGHHQRDLQLEKLLEYRGAT